MSPTDARGPEPDHPGRTERRRSRLAALGTVRAAVLIVASLTFFGLLAGMVLSFGQPPRWTASTSVMVRVGAQDRMLLQGDWGQASFEDQIDLAAMATSQDALLAVARQLDLRDSLADLQENISAAPKGSSHVLVFSATQPDPVQAQRVADAIAQHFVESQQRRLSTLIQSLAVPRPAAAPRADPGPEPAPAPEQGPDPDIVERGELLTRTIQPLELFHDDLPTRPAPERAPVALGIVGLAAGAMVVLALTFLAPRVDRPRDAQRLLALPSVRFHREGRGPEAERLVRALLRANPDGELLVCPVDADAELAAVRFAGWARQHQGSVAGQPPRGIRLVPEPTSAVVGARPDEADIAGLMLVVPRGTARPTVSDAAELLGAWRPADAVVVSS